ncbi:hypothetical protein FCJ61_00075 [Burkholderia metallica]|uniref:DUF7661 family protein n=1 Tax=Burkholderia metallica TaxID=488729 RepID=UPI00157AA8B3|nr:hypothetical protein [Burkholderia metallica]
MSPLRNSDSGTHPEDLTTNFNIYGRFQVDVRRKKDSWVVYRSELGKRTMLNDVVIPPTVVAGEVATYLDDIFLSLPARAKMLN